MFIACMSDNFCIHSPHKGFILFTTIKKIKIEISFSAQQYTSISSFRFSNRTVITLSYGFYSLQKVNQLPAKAITQYLGCFSVDLYSKVWFSFLKEKGNNFPFSLYRWSSKVSIRYYGRARVRQNSRWYAVGCDRPLFRKNLILQGELI